VVHPTPTVAAVAHLTHCDKASAPAISFTGPVAGTTFAWSATADLGFGTNGVGTIPPYTARNAGAAPLTNVVTVTPSANGCTGSSSTFKVTVNALPLAPLSLGDVTNSTEQAAAPVLLVTNLTAGASIDWFDASQGGNQVATNSSSFLPPERSPGRYTYYAEALSPEGCVSANRTPVTLVVEGLTLSIEYAGRTNIVIQWLGEYNLQSTTNLLQPALNSNWALVFTNAVVGTNTYITNSSGSTVRFYRLFKP
jgi:hypothetical protein